MQSFTEINGTFAKKFTFRAAFVVAKGYRL